VVTNLSIKIVSIIKNLYALFLVILACQPIPFLSDLAYFETYSKAVLGITIIFLSFFLFKKVTISKSILLVIIILIFHNMLIAFKYQTLHPRVFLIYLSTILYAYIGLMLLKNKIFEYLENIIYTLALITIPLYIWGNVHPISLIQFLNLFAPYISDHGGISTLFFVYRPDSSYGVLRNCGFCWEPGMFAIIINTALLINLLKNNFQLNLRVIIYILLLISTFSTTGYVSLFFVLLLFLINVNISKGVIFFLTLILIPIVIYVSQLNFISDKINESLQQNLSDLIDQSLSSNDETSLRPQRLLSFKITFIDFIQNPAIGYGGNDEAGWLYKKYGKQVNILPVSGIGNFIATFGLFGLFFLILACYKSALSLKYIYLIKHTYLIFIIFLIFFISYRIVDMAIFHCFFLFYLVKND
jgi:hypothetical protein